MLVLPRSITENTGMESLAKWRKDSRFKYHLNALNRDISIPDFGGCHNTQKLGDLFVPTIGTNAFFFIRFWPKTSQDSRIVTK